MKEKAKAKVDEKAGAAKRKAAGAKARAVKKIGGVPGGEAAAPLKGVAQQKVEGAGAAADAKTEAGAGAAKGAIEKVGK